jgi:hypothetical protein
MSYVHCNSCHHEWECSCNKQGKVICDDCVKVLCCLAQLDRTCDWCGGGSYILESVTPLSQTLNDFNLINMTLELIEKNNPESKEIAKKIFKHGIKKKRKK